MWVDSRFLSGVLRRNSEKKMSSIHLYLSFGGGGVKIPGSVFYQLHMKKNDT